ncbi:MAG TPA: hypothetical protein VHQ24_16615 [Lachnospiraceae bacterium]|nr:hypothetical protein [Lachnospiraceae bacterium]
MDEIILFINDFIEKEYEAFIACYSEKDEEIFEDKQNQVDLMYSSGLRTIVQRGCDPQEEWFIEGEKQLQVVRKRILFQIKKYQHSEFDILYECSLSDPLGYFVTKDGVETPNWFDDISSILYVANVKNLRTGEWKMKIVADYHCAANRFAYGSKKVEPLGIMIECLDFHTVE